MGAHALDRHRSLKPKSRAKYWKASCEVTSLRFSRGSLESSRFAQAFSSLSLARIGGGVFFVSRFVGGISFDEALFYDSRDFHDIVDAVPPMRVFDRLAILLEFERRNGSARVCKTDIRFGAALNEARIGKRRSSSRLWTPLD